MVAPSKSITAAPTMVEVGSPEFQAAVRAAVAASGANVSGTTLQAENGLVAQTSIDTSRAGLDDLTVRFRRFCSFNGCGYQRDQEAGFPRHLAEMVAASGAAFIVHDPRRQR